MKTFAGSSGEIHLDNVCDFLTTDWALAILVLEKVCTVKTDAKMTARVEKCVAVRIHAHNTTEIGCGLANF